MDCKANGSWAPARHAGDSDRRHIQRILPPFYRTSVDPAVSGAAENRWSIRLLLVVNGDWNDNVRRSLEEQVRDVIGYAVDLDVAVVDDIPLTAAGKRKVVVRSVAASC